MASKANDPRIFDQRTLDINLSRGTIKKADFDKYLASLPDEEGNYDHVLVDEEELTHTFSWDEEDDANDADNE